MDNKQQSRALNHCQTSKIYSAPNYYSFVLDRAEATPSFVQRAWKRLLYAYCSVCLARTNAKEGTTNEQRQRKGGEKQSETAREKEIERAKDRNFRISLVNLIHDKSFQIT